MFKEYDETLNRKSRLIKYTFRFRDASGKVKTKDVYAVDEQTAAIMFNRVYFKEGVEVL